MKSNKLIISPKGEDGHKTFSIRIPDTLADKIEKVVISTNRTRNEIINIFLEYAVDNCEIDSGRGE